MSETIVFTGSLTVVTCWCGMRHAVPTELREFQLREHQNGRHKTVYCPLGHEYSPAGESKCHQLSRQLEAEKKRTAAAIASHDQTRAALREKDRELIAQKGVNTKLKKRVGNGVCPCCGRTFKQLARHMESKHPEYKTGDQP